MRLVVGGAYQGKLAVARELEDIDQARIIDGKTCDREQLQSAGILNGLQEYLRRFPTDNPEEFVRNLKENNPEIILVMNELGCGVVPMEKEDRAWREMCGRVSIVLARESTEVYRVICGLASRIK